VTGGIQDGEVLPLGLEVSSADLNSFAFIALWKESTKPD
jgi:hypothetical protein